VLQPKIIWVLPELSSTDKEIGKLSLGLLSEAANISRRVENSSTIALIFGDQGKDFKDTFNQYEIDTAYVFKHDRLRNYSTELYFSALLEKLKNERPWLIMLGNTIVGKELGPKLAFALGTGVVPNCVKIDFVNPQQPHFFRPILGEQIYQEIVFDDNKTMIVTFDPDVLNTNSGNSLKNTEIVTIEPSLNNITEHIKHLEYLPVDYRKIDVADADLIIGAGAGVVDNQLLALTQELSDLIEGSLGATRPVVDEGKMPRERLIGQTGKIVSPSLYLALGISGATHHVGGIQQAKTIVAVNRDPQAAIFDNSDLGLIADLKGILPVLIEKIRQAKQDGKIL
jgi:electron transfer flavoprotein alpha subunit